MCGRFTLSRFDRLEKAFGEYRFPVSQQRYNVAPATDVFVKRNDDTREVVGMRWGLVPSWAKDLAIGNRLINARAESLAEKPSFRDALKKRRGLIFADGFYEWRKTADGKKEPILFRLASGEPFAFAALWERWYGPPGARLDTPVETATIITTEPNELLARVHDRMPVILPRDVHERWLDADAMDPHLATSHLLPYAAREMVGSVVSNRVNRPGYQEPDCIDDIAPF